MRRVIVSCLAVPCSSAPLSALHAQTRPLVDHHQHFFSVGIVGLVSPKPTPPPRSRLALPTRFEGSSAQRATRSDGASGGNLPPRQSWAAFRQLPLTDGEFSLIANNVAPWMR